jgi:hypothetical protein
MIRRWFQHQRRGAAAGGQPASVPPDELANAAIDGLAEDEALRGDLTDEGYQPLQDWAVARLQRIAREAAHHPDPHAAMEGYTTQMREFLRAAVQAAQDGALGDLSALVKPRIVLAADVPATIDALKQIEFTSDADANAQAITSALVSASGKEESA